MQSSSADPLRQPGDQSEVLLHSNFEEVAIICHAVRFHQINKVNTEPLPAYLVEDSAMIRANLTTTLEELCGIKIVAAAESESEALNWLADPEQNWRLAIVDVILRPGSGLKVLKACKNRKPEQKVVVLTNYATAEMRKACLNLGADAVFDKSGEIDALIEYCCLLASGHSGPVTE